MEIAARELVMRIRQVRRRLNSLKSNLERFGYEFDNVDYVLPGPEPGTDRIIKRIEDDVGALPSCILAFWREIGSVNFCGHHPNWNGCEYADPIFVYPPSAAEAELEDYLIDRERYVHAFGGFRIPVAPDYHGKEDVSGGMWYGIQVPDSRVDVPLLHERHDTTFLDYLEIALRWAGFPGVEYADRDHSWPIHELLKDRLR